MFDSLHFSHHKIQEIELKRESGIYNFEDKVMIADTSRTITNKKFLNIQKNGEQSIHKNENKNIEKKN